MTIGTIGYMNPATEGTTLIFDCPPEYVLIGPQHVWGMENGNQIPKRWNAKVEDSFRNVLCDIKIFHSFSYYKLLNIVHVACMYGPLLAWGLNMDSSVMPNVESLSNTNMLTTNSISGYVVVGGQAYAQPKQATSVLPFRYRPY